MERGPREPEISFETQELLAHPEQVFDSDQAAAEKQSRELMERLLRIGEIKRSNNQAQFEIKETAHHSIQKIQIAWPAGEQGFFLLNLEPVTEGRDFEQGVFGFIGTYGPAKREQDEYVFVEKMSLEELFGVPDDLRVIIEPTIDRWAIETSPNPLTTAIFGQNARKMYMGLGFLFLGHEWMHIGMHEAGHLPQNHDENLAWTKANRRYASLHKPQRADIIAGKNKGRFDLLKEPEPTDYGETPSIGDIAKYGLVSHALAQNAHIPPQWNVERISSDFGKIIMAANREYEDFVGR